jgi:hypothetical protein
LGGHHIDALRGFGFKPGENEAMTLGQRLMDLILLHPVVDRQPFRGGKFFIAFIRTKTKRASDSRQRLFEIGLDIVNVLDADRQPH